MNGCKSRRAEHKDHLWSYGFVMDRSTSMARHSLVCSSTTGIIFSRRPSSVRSITAEGVIGTLGRLFGQRGAPALIRSDNGPEFVARALKR